MVQAVVRFEPCRSTLKVAAQGVFLRQRYNDSARAELPMSYQFFGGAGASWPVSLDLRICGRRAANRLSAERVAKAGAVAEGFEPVSKRRAV